MAARIPDRSWNERGPAHLTFAASRGLQLCCQPCSFSTDSTVLYSICGREAFLGWCGFRAEAKSRVRMLIGGKRRALPYLHFNPGTAKNGRKRPKATPLACLWRQRETSRNGQVRAHRHGMAWHGMAIQFHFIQFHSTSFNPKLQPSDERPSKPSFDPVVYPSEKTEISPYKISGF